MKCYQRWSTETLKNEKENLLYFIEDWERTLANTISLLILFSLSHSIKNAKEDIHAIDAELCYREVHSK